MAAPRFAWGIDVGNRALKAVKLVAGADGLVIDEFDVVEHETVLSASGDNRDSLVQTALATFVSRHPGIEKGLVGIGVPGKSAFAKFVPLPPVEKKKIPEIVRFEAMQQIPFPLDDVEWSYQLFEDPTSPDVEVGIFAMRRELVNENIKFFTDAKLNVQVVQMNPLAVYNAMYYDSRIKGTTMIVDLGAENTDLIIADGESVWLRSISIGGNQFTEALTKAFKVPFDKAEELKRNASTSKYGKQIMQAMRPFFADLVSEIQRSIGFYSSVHKESRVTRVVALGSTFRLPGLQKYLQQNLSLEVEKLDRLSAGALEDPKSAAMFSENILSAAGAYGLALQVMGQGKIGSNLLPIQIRKEKMWREKTKWFIAAAAMVVLGAGVGFGREWFEEHAFHDPDHTAVAQQIDHTETIGNSDVRDWAKIETDGTAARNAINNVLALKDGKDVWPQLDRAVAASLPQNATGADPALSSGDIEALKKIPRGNRNQVVIESMVSEYVPDLNELIAHPELLPDRANIQGAEAPSGQADGFNGGGGGQPAPSFAMGGGGGGAGGMRGGGGQAFNNGGNGGQGGGNNNAEPQRGYIITMKLLTPNTRGTGIGIIEDLIGTLSAIHGTPDRPFEFKEVRLVKKVSATERSTELENAYNTALKEKQLQAGGAVGPSDQPAGMGGGAGNPRSGNGWVHPAVRPDVAAAPGGGSKVPEEAYHDQVTGEDARKDTECYIVAEVLLDPPAAKATAPAPGKSVASAR
jgi:type IV pilus assembly protein PilM